MGDSHVAGWASDAPTPAQLKEFFAQVESGRITRRGLQAFLRGEEVFSLTEAAREILGGDFITPDDITRVGGISYRMKERNHLMATLPQPAILKGCREDGYVLIAGPPVNLGWLPDIIYLWPRYFSFSNAPSHWISGLAGGDRATTDWLAIRKEPVPASMNKPLPQQRKLLFGYDRVPNASELGWFLAAFYAVRGIRLLPESFVRTSSISPERVGRFSCHIYLGGFSSEGIKIGYCVDSSTSRNMGIAAAREIRP